MRHSRAPLPVTLLIKTRCAAALRKLSRSCDAASVSHHLVLLSSELLMAASSNSGTLVLRRVEAHWLCLQRGNRARSTATASRNQREAEVKLVLDGVLS